MLKTWPFWKTFLSAYLAMVGGIWGFVQVYDYFERDVLQQWLGPSGWIIYFLLPLPVAFSVAAWTNAREETKAESLDQRNRRVMLDHVENFWVKGVLEKSLHGAALLELGIKEDPGAVSYPWTIKRETTNETLPAGKSMFEIFEEIGLGRSLLILGAPGSGKTTMLLELARQLIELAREDDDLREPIPVVFNLASWTEKQTISDWLAEQLNIVYYVPKKTAARWVSENMMLLLLDGLDEVKAESRARCVEAINQFRKEHGLTSVVVCSRIEEYAMLNAKLSLQGAITIQPLSPRQINAYFDRFGKSLAEVKQLIRRDKDLAELAGTPLMLSIMVMTYKGLKPEEFTPLKSQEGQRKHLFDTYIDRMFERPTRMANTSFTKRQTLHYLSWLARVMNQHNIITYQIEAMQPSWLTEASWRKLYQVLVSLFWGLLSGLLGVFIFGPIVGLVIFLIVALILRSLTKLDRQELVNRFMEDLWEQSWNRALPKGVSEELTFAVRELSLYIRGLWLGFLRGLGSEITMVDKLAWSWKKALGGLGIGLIVGLGGGLIVRPQSIGLSGLIGSLGFGLLGALLSGLSVPQVKAATRPGQRLRQTFTFSILAYLASGIIMTLISGLLIGASGLKLGLSVGLLVGLSLGGIALIQHYLLRFILSQGKLWPWRLIPFLDYAVDLIFLRRVGGSYIFVHRLVMEHFAEMEV